MSNILQEDQVIGCDACNKEALIFQEEGNFCLNCWQDRTEPDITVRDDRVNLAVTIKKYMLE
jgi:hypothetical protein